MCRASSMIGKPSEVTSVPASAARAPAAQTRFNIARQKCRCHTSIAKKLRYMSKIAAIFSASDNTQLNSTQPIGNLPTARV